MTKIGSKMSEKQYITKASQQHGSWSLHSFLRWVEANNNNGMGMERPSFVASRGDRRCGAQSRGSPPHRRRYFSIDP